MSPTLAVAPAAGQALRQRTGEVITEGNPRWHQASQGKIQALQQAVSRKPSQRCPACWAVAKKALSERVHACPSCGHTEPRDPASARTVLRWALLGHNTG